ncbi:unnamed protein product [Cochlearia groenlandica]
MSKISNASSLSVLFFVFFLLSSHPTLSLRVPITKSEPKYAQTMTDDSSSMGKINHAKSMVAGFFSHKFPLKGWPYPKYPPFTMGNPKIPTNPSTGAQEESAKLPSSPSNGNKGGNA